MQNWPSPDTELGAPFRTFKEEFGSAYQVFFEFQLGRFYALAGNTDRARTLLNSIVSLPPNPDNARYLDIAQLYLNNLNDLEAAEKTIAGKLKIGEGVSSKFEATTSGSDITPPLIPEIGLIEELIFQNSNPTAAIQQIETALPNCRSKEYEPYDCGRLLYLLGLAEELLGDQRSAVQAYWQLWQDYPDSLYTVMARLKLETAIPQS